MKNFNRNSTAGGQKAAKKPAYKKPMQGERKQSLKFDIAGQPYKKTLPDTSPNYMEEDPPLSVIEGRNAVLEAIRSGHEIEKLYVAHGDIDKTLKYIISLAREKGIPIMECDPRKIMQMSETRSPQGILAVASAYNYSDIDDILALAAEREEKPLIIICDGITDPRNLGAIIRCAEVFGAHGVIIPKRRSAGLTALTAKAAAGAIEHLPVARTPNIPTLIDSLKKLGIWIYGAVADNRSSPAHKSDFKDGTAIVIGSEGDGVSKLVLSKCDGTAAIEMKGKTGSLNASAAAAVLLYEASRQRG